MPRRGNVEESAYVGEAVVNNGMVSVGASVTGKARIMLGAIVTDHSIVDGATIPAGCVVSGGVVLASSGILSGSIGGRTWCAYTTWQGAWRVRVQIGCQDTYLDSYSDVVLADYASQFSSTDARRFFGMLYAIRELIRQGIVVPVEAFDREAFLAERGVPSEIAA